MTLRDFARQVRMQLRAALRPGPRPTILMYHRIARESFDPWGLTVTPGRFTRQLEWLARNRTVLSLEDFAVSHRARTLPDSAVALTFDDGYACALETAGPELGRLALPATVFLPAELIERDREFWWDDLERVVIGSPNDALLFEGRQILTGAADPRDQHWPPGQSARTPRQLAYHRLWKLLHGQPEQYITRAMDELRAQAGQAAQPRTSHRPLRRDDFSAPRPANLSFGAHGLTHTSLPLLPQLDLEHEIGKSAAQCAEITGEIPRTFAYPFGDCDEIVSRSVARAGYLCACTSRRGAVDGRSRTFALPRLAVGDWEPAQLGLMLAAL